MTKIMVLSLPASAVISGAWVFDSVIVVRFATTNKLLIYQKPLVAGGTKFPLTMNEYGIPYNTTYDAIELGRNNNNASEIYLYGVVGGKILRYTFSIALDLN